MTILYTIFMNLNRGYLMILGAGVCWATTGLFGTILFRQGIDPLLVASSRLSLAAIFFFLLLFFRFRTSLIIKFAALPRLFIFGLLGVALFNVFYLHAIDNLGVSVAVALLYTAPAFVIIVSRLFLKEWITPVKSVALLLTTIGVFLVVGTYDFTRWTLEPRGIALGVGAGFTFGLISIFSKVALRRHTEFTITFYFILTGAILLSLLKPPWLLLLGKISPATLPALLALALISTFLPYLLYISGLKYLEAGKGSIVAAVEPVAAFSFAALFLGERLLVPQFIGFIFVVGAVLLLVYKS
ncbi:MAG: DMT family transporter [Bacillota bacterium]